MPEFKKITDFPRGTIYDILRDAYSYDERNQSIWDRNWKETDDFFYDNPEIADKYGLVTCIDGEPIGFVTWDPRNRPEYVEIGHNGIREKYKRQGYGRKQLEEAIRRIKEYDGLKRIIVCTNSNLAASKNYESVGFRLYDRKKNETESAYTGDYLYYEFSMQSVKQLQLINDDYLGHVDKLRHACRGILMKGDKVLLSYESNNGKFIIPGGGVEANETYAMCCEREMLEETGMKVKAVREFLEIEELFDVWRHINHYFICELIEDTGVQKLTEGEQKAGYTYVWKTMSEALAIFGTYEDYHDTDIAVYGLYRREFFALSEV